MSDIILIANGDLRLSANRVCWTAQKQTEDAVMAAIRREGGTVRRGLRSGYVASALPPRRSRKGYHEH